MADFILTFDLQANTNVDLVQTTMRGALTEDNTLMSGAVGQGNYTVDLESIIFNGKKTTARWCVNIGFNKNDCWSILGIQNNPLIYFITWNIVVKISFYHKFLDQTHRV